MTTFAMEPAQGRYLWFIIPVAIVMIVAFWLLFTTVRSSRTATFEIANSTLYLRGDVYGRSIPLSRLRAELAHRVDFANEPGLQPRSRRLGTALPGYQAGWFRLRDGQKALLYLTDRSKAVYVPTAEDYALLLSPSDPDAFLRTLKSASR